MGGSGTADIRTSGVVEGQYVLHGAVVVYFRRAEWQAFIGGIGDGEFDVTG